MRQKVIDTARELGLEVDVRRLDESLLEHERVYAAGGDGNSLFEVGPRRLLECTGATLAPVTGDHT